MRTLLMAALLLGLLLSTACKTPPPPGTTGEVETWTMMSWIAFSPSVPDLEAGDIIYRINWSTNELEIEYADDDVEGVQHAGGKYDFTLSTITNEDGTNQLLVVDGTDYYLTFTDDKQGMTWDSNTNPMLSNDLPVMNFDRMD